jgi:hypothetical protein
MFLLLVEVDGAEGVEFGLILWGTSVTADSVSVGMVYSSCKSASPDDVVAVGEVV